MSQQQMTTATEQDFIDLNFKVQSGTHSLQLSWTNQNLLSPGYEKFMESAKHIYQDYIVDMKYLMLQFSLQSEEEVILGKAVKLHSFLDADSQKVSLSLQENFLALLCKLPYQKACGEQYSLDILK